jgi:predicted anti-sigma-YlaC factor YlaD
MRCSKASQQLQLYLDSQLRLNQVRELEAHLARCPACQRELLLLEKVSDSLRALHPVVEPADLTTNIMRRVALSQRHQQERAYRVLRPSLVESLAAIVLAMLTTLVIILGQAPLRQSLPFVNQLDLLSLTMMNDLHQLLSSGGSTLLLVLWIGGTILGLCITWMAAGRQMRATWSKAMLDRLSVR